MTSSNTPLTIIIPAYNEAAGIEETLNELHPLVRHLKARVIVVDDGSTDATAEQVSRFNWVKLIRHPYNKGYGASVKTGVHAVSNSEVIALYDADGQHRPADLESLWSKFGTYDLLIGTRSRGSHKALLRRPGKRIISWYARFLTGRKIPDLNSGLRLFRLRLIRKVLHLMPDGFSFSTTSTIAFHNLGYNVGFEPIVTRKRVGKSSVRQVRDGVGTLVLILRLTVLFNPLKVFLPAAALFILVGAVYESIYGIYLYYPNEPKLLAGAFFSILTGLIIFFFGLVVDQLAEMRKHPLGE